MLRAGFFENQPFMMTDADDNVIGGIAYELQSVLEERLGFSFAYTREPAVLATDEKGRLVGTVPKVIQSAHLKVADSSIYFLIQQFFPIPGNVWSI